MWENAWTETVMGASQDGRELYEGDRGYAWTEGLLDIIWDIRRTRDAR